MKPRVAVLGATGYAGWELIKLLLRHPLVELAWAQSEQHAGKTLNEVAPHLPNLPLVSSSNLDFSSVDVLFSCLPHGQSHLWSKALNQKNLLIIDLSADHRIESREGFVYGQTEWCREQIQGAKRIANPGCYPTTVLLGALPIVKAGLAHPDLPLVVDSKSGLSGAGKSLSLRTHFVEADENLTPYSVVREHRHLPEMEHHLKLGGNPFGNVVFSPQLVPLSRGMLSSIYVPLREAVAQQQIQDLYKERYGSEKFVYVLDSEPAQIAQVKGTNNCHISIHTYDKLAVVFCTIDNLLKGASGQALQNMNVAMGFPEGEGLFL